MLKRGYIGNKPLIIFFLSALLLFGCNQIDYDSGKEISAEEIIDIGQIQNVTSDKGFTCTGLSFNKKDNVFYLGNIGALTPDDTIRSSIEVISGDFSTWLGSIDISTLSDTIRDIQGITFDSNSETIWFCSFSENLIYNISKEGEYLFSFSADKPTGLLYDPSTDSLWVLSYTEICNFDKSGEKIKSYKVKIKGQDQMCFGEDGYVYFTAGNNYQGTNYVFQIDLSNGKLSPVFTLLDSFAVEGIYMTKDQMIILNDGRYHSAKDNRNLICVYKIAGVQ